MLVWWPHPPAGQSSPRSPDLRIFMSDAYLARSVEQQASGMQTPGVQNVRITSNPPASLIVRCDLSVGPLSAPAALEVAPVVQAGQVQTRLISTQVGSVPIPPQLTGFVADAINGRIKQLPAGTGRVTGLRVLSSGLEITARYP